MPGVELGVGTETEETERRGDRDIEGNQREELIPCLYALPGPTRAPSGPGPPPPRLPAPVSPAGSPSCPRNALPSLCLRTLVLNECPRRLRIKEDPSSSQCPPSGCQDKGTLGSQLGWAASLSAPQHPPTPHPAPRV